MNVSRQRRLDKAQSRVDRVTEADSRFFERFPGRNHRVRLASSAELEQNAAVADVEAIPATRGSRWLVLVKQLTPGVRMRAFVESMDWHDLDLSEKSAAFMYGAVVRPGTQFYQIEQQMQAALARMGSRH